VKHDLPACFAAVSNVQILPCEGPSVKLVDAFQSALRTQFQRACFQHFIKVLFLKAVFVCALGKDDHFELCIAYARVERTSQDWVALAGRAAAIVGMRSAEQTAGVVGALEFQLTAEEISEIDAARRA
jgi:hypothetical protein